MHLKINSSMRPRHKVHYFHSGTREIKSPNLANFVNLRYELILFSTRCRNSFWPRGISLNDSRKSAIYLNFSKVEGDRWTRPPHVHTLCKSLSRYSISFKHYRNSPRVVILFTESTRLFMPISGFPWALFSQGQSSNDESSQSPNESPEKTEILPKLDCRSMTAH